MKDILKLLLLVFFLSKCSFAFAQEDINNEAFKLKFSSTRTGANIIYTGKSHSFSITITGPNIKESKVESKQDNQEFIDVGNDVVQTSLVPLLQPIPPEIHLGKLTETKIKEILEGYVNYELDYFKNELHHEPKNLQREWKTINSKLCLIWAFEFKADKTYYKKFSAQVYISTICFNQVLDLNMPLSSKDNYLRSKKLLESIASTLKTFNKP